VFLLGKCKNEIIFEIVKVCSDRIVVNMKRGQAYWGTSSNKPNTGFLIAGLLMGLNRPLYDASSKGRSEQHFCLCARKLFPTRRNQGLPPALVELLG
jgi:hypothetical protein